LNEISPKAKEIFVSSVKNLGNLTASTKELIEALTQWQPLVGEYEAGDMSFAVSRRTSWLFPNGYVLVISHSFGPHISHVDELIVWDSTPPVPEDSKKNWKVENYANGWRPKSEPREFPNTDVILDLLEAMTEINGNPKLIIPWRETWAQDLVDEGDDFFDSPFEDSEIDPVRRAVQDMFKSVLAGKVDSQSPWEVEFTDGEAYLPSFCGYMELVKFLDEIEKQELAIVVRNVSVDYTKEKDAKEIRAENPKRAHLPIIWVPNDWAMLTYFGNGWVNELVIYVADPELEKRMYILVEEMELSLYPRWEADEVEADGWKAVGSFQIGSDFD
jgi:hypothetical protein